MPSANILDQVPTDRIWAYHPFKPLYITYVFLTIGLLMPYWAVHELLRSRRPRPSWPLFRCLAVRTYRHIQKVVAACQLDIIGRDPRHAPYAFLLGHTHFIWCAPASDEWVGNGWVKNVMGDVERCRQAEGDKGASGWDWLKGGKKVLAVESMRTPCFLYAGKKHRHEGMPPLQPGERVILHLHGGAFIVGSSHELDPTAKLCKNLISAGPIRRIYSVDYRLAWYSPFPAALLDALAGWLYLVETMGIEPSNIIVSGDSAGGNLAMALARHLRDQGKEGPRALLLMSPWSDLSFSHHGPGSSQQNAECDIMEETLAPYAVSLYLRHTPPETIHSPYVSPCSPRIPILSHGPESFESFPPTLIVAGGAERLLDEVADLRKRFKAAAVPIEYYEIPDGVHDSLMFGWMRPEADAALGYVSQWIEKRWESSGVQARVQVEEVVVGDEESAAKVGGSVE